MPRGGVGQVGANEAKPSLASLDLAVAGCSALGRIQIKERPLSKLLLALDGDYPLAVTIALILPVALVLATLLLAALTGILPLLVGVVSAALLTRLVLVTLVLLSALIRIISHCAVSFNYRYRKPFALFIAVFDPDQAVGNF
jgi:hypothetical protein